LSSPNTDNVHTLRTHHFKLPTMMNKMLLTWS